MRRPLLLAAGAAVVLLAAAAAWYAVRPDPAAALFDRAHAARSAGDSEAARALFTEVASRYPRSAYATAARRLAASPDAAGASPADEPITPDEMARLARFWRSEADSAAGTRRGADALYRLAVTLDNLGEVPGAISAWEEFVRRYPADERVPEALYGLGYVERTARRDDAAARRRFEQVIRRYPGTRFAVEAQAQLDAMDAPPPADVAPPPPATIHTAPGGL